MQLYKSNLRQPEAKKKKSRRQESQGHRKKGMVIHPGEKAREQVNFLKQRTRNYKKKLFAAI